MHKARTLIIIAVSCGAVIGTAAGANASDGKTAPGGSRVISSSNAPQAANAPSASNLAPGFQFVSVDFTADPGTQTRGTATCPGTKQVVGGGAFDFGSLPAVSINSSFPTGQSWNVDINNASASADTVRAYAICVRRARLYQVVLGATVPHPAGSQVRATAVCPKGTYPTGGGAISGSFSTSVHMNSNLPSGRKWIVDENNASASDTTLRAYAVCAKKFANYVVVTSASQTNPAGQKTVTYAPCPAGEQPLSGGEFSSSGSTAVKLNSTYPAQTASDIGWASVETNSSAGDATTTSYAICVTTS